ncbi:MAG TPA: serine hydrolase [Gemmatimonadaceae bacterium]|nr:serine hydrolase [Gemmatimonadaceae bacterium]
MLTLALAAALTAFGDGLPAAAPAAVGMSAERLEAIDRVVQRGVSEGGYPGAAVVVGRKGSAVLQKGYGTLGWTRGSARVSAANTIYDLASLTKVVGTTTAVMILYDEGKIDLDAPVKTYLPAFSGGNKNLVTVRHLLLHRSGLPAGRDLWRIAHTPAEARRAVIATSLTARPGARYEYSDLGADLLGFVVEAVAGEPLDRFLERRVFEPLGMRDTGFRPADSLRYRVAPTEVAPPRGYPLRGEVHDENAYALGGVAGHAGLFSTAADLSVFAQMMLNGGVYDGVRIVREETVRLFTRREKGSRALGWDTAEGGVGAGRYLTDRAYGHTGYTGTSIWIDPEREMFVILLTNRVHAAKARRPARVISDVRADLADAAAFAVVDMPSYYMTKPVSYRADRAAGWNEPTPVRRATRVRSARSKAAEKARAAAKQKASAKKGTVKKKSTATQKGATKSGARPSTSKSGAGKGSGGE